VSSQYRDPDPSRPEAGDTVTLASDGDRDAAAGVLNEAFAEGRLTADEHTERLRAVFAARTRPELARLTADLPDPVQAAGRPATGTPDGLDRCLLCALLICCPPAGIAWLLAARHRVRAAQRHALAAAPSPSDCGAVRTEVVSRAEDR
jgi:Domain of unknown function (DUF1707)